jgi:hypothetical protein
MKDEMLRANRRFRPFAVLLRFLEAAKLSEGKLE